MSLDDHDLPAILGGNPIRPAGPPVWPARIPAVEGRVMRALADGSWGHYHGPHVAELTKLLAECHQFEHVFPCASGTVAVELALRGLGVGPGDEVILAAYDFKGNFTDILTVGATPVLVDVRPDNWNLSVENLQTAIGPQTKAMLVSHLHGGVVDMPAVRVVADERRIPVIEDAAQMPGSRIHGRIAGTWGDIGVLSFGGSKLVSAGRGGAVLTPRADVAQRIRLYTQRGNDAYPLSELQAAAVIPQWELLDAARTHRARSAAWLFGGLTKIPGIQPFQNPISDSQPDYYKVGVQYDAAAFAGLSRDEFAVAIRAEGIALDPGFRSLHRIHSARRFRTAGSLDEANRADTGVLTLHHPVLLEPENALQEVVSAIERVRRFAKRIVQTGAAKNKPPGAISD